MDMEKAEQQQQQPHPEDNPQQQQQQQPGSSDPGESSDDEPVIIQHSQSPESNNPKDSDVSKGELMTSNGHKESESSDCPINESKEEQLEPENDETQNSQNNDSKAESESADVDESKGSTDLLNDANIEVEVNEESLNESTEPSKQEPVEEDKKIESKEESVNEVKLEPSEAQTSPSRDDVTNEPKKEESSEALKESKEVTNDESQPENLSTVKEAPNAIDVQKESKEVVADLVQNVVTESESNQAKAGENGAKPKVTPLPAEDQGIYHVKQIGFEGKKIPIVTQNVNGPCPLISIVNVLLLRGKISLPNEVEVISAEQLLQHLADCLLNRASNSAENDANFQQNISDAVSILPKLRTGLDVNVKFNAVDAFEFTPELVIFDLLGIQLFHGWLVDPQLREVHCAVGDLSYNALVERAISGKEPEASIAQHFLAETASQLTVHGLCELNSAVKEGTLSVFFRNNHFSTLFKLNKELFLLATDQGFIKESSVVWETLSSIDGDGHFVDENFVTIPAANPEPVKEEPEQTRSNYIQQE